MRNVILGLVLALAGSGMSGSWQPARAQVPVDLELVLAVDVSGSMDPEEQLLQRAGYMEAITSADVVAAIRAGAMGRIALSYVEWAGPAAQRVIVPWRTVGDAASAAAFTAELATAPTSRIRGTSISGGLTFAAGLFDGNGYESLRRVIDVSGDGPNNMGLPVEPARDAVLRQGIVINGLPIMLRPSGGSFGIADLDRYYEACVIGGGGAFVLAVRHPDQLADAIRQKLVLEIAGNVPRVIHAAAPGPVDCMIGEELRRQWDP